MKTIDRSALMRDTRQIGIRLGMQCNKTLEREGITGGQGQILLYILRHPAAGVSLTALHQASGFSMASISGQVKHLREKGYVRAESCAEDDRRKILYATEKSRRLQEFLDQALQTTQQQLYRDFTEEELGTLERLQKKMLQNLSDCSEARPKEESQP